MSDPAIEGAYDGARVAQISVDAGRSGTYTLDFERSLPPLRWKLNDGAAGWTLTLLDDGALSAAPDVSLFSFDAPNESAPIADAVPLRSFGTAEQGGLYLAVRGADVATAIAPPKRRVLRDLREFAFPGRFSPIPREPGRLQHQFRLLRFWSAASLPGHPLARSWRAHVVQDLQAYLVHALTGRRWAEAEEALFRTETPALLARLAADISSASPAAQRQARSIADDSEALNRLPIEHRIDAFQALMSQGSMLAGQAWQRLVTVRGADAKTWAAEFYLRLATDPEVERWAGSRMPDGLLLTTAWSLPLRVARYLALTTVLETSGRGAYPPLFRGWTWQ
jgi:hypothetical protein